MAKYISILRGINVSGQKIIKMADLRTHLSTIGLTNVSTYIQSGNIIFDSELNEQLEISKHIADKIRNEYGFEVPVLTLKHEELVAAAENNPYNGNEPVEQLLITFLETEATQEHIASIDSEKYLPDEFTIQDKTVYLNIKGGYGKSKLSNNFFESKLKVKATTRNMKTVYKLIELSQ